LSLLQPSLPFCAAPNITVLFSGVVNKSQFSVELRGFRPLYDWIGPFGALTHYYAFCTMLRRKQRSETNADW
jgi:hypothetical protein